MSNNIVERSELLKESDNIDTKFLTSSIGYIPEYLKTEELCRAAVLADGVVCVGESQIQSDNNERENDVTLVIDTMRMINEYLTDKNDTISLAKVNKEWEHALEGSVDKIWEDEWFAFKEKNKNERWFTETVYNVPYKESSWKNTINSIRNFVGKEPKDYQSWRQWYYDERKIIENPTPIQLLIANAENKINAMTDEEWKKMIENQPTLKLMAKKAGCIVAAPILGAIGLALLPLSCITVGGVTMYRKCKGTTQRGRGGPIPADLAEFLIIAAPTAFPWLGAASALDVVVSDKCMRKIPELYKSFGEYHQKRIENKKLKGDEMEPKNQKLRYTN